MNKVKLGFIGAGWWATSNHMPLLAAREGEAAAAENAKALRQRMTPAQVNEAERRSAAWSPQLRSN